MRCPICYTRVGNMQVHDEHVCEKQQKVNEENRMRNGVIPSYCPWCGKQCGSHEISCPNK